MEKVQPIRDLDQVKAIYDTLAARNPRDAFMWGLGVHLGLRISDLLPLRVADVWVAGIGAPRKHLRLRDRKTGKATRRLLTPRARQEIEAFCPGLAPRRFLFQSRQGSTKAITASRAWQILSRAAAEHGIQEVGTHTMRKTFGFHLYMQTGDIAKVMEALNHSSQADTLRYICVTDDQMDETLMAFDLMPSKSL